MSVVEPLLRAEGVEVPASWGRVHVHLSLYPGDRVGITGEAKSLTELLRVLARLSPLRGGRLFWAGVEVGHRPRWRMRRALRHSVVMLLADPYATWEPWLAVREVVTWRGGSLWREAGRPLFAGLLPMVVLGERVAALSGVARVRLAVARAMMLAPRVLLFDDFFSHIVPEAWPRLVEEIDRLAGQTCAVLFASRHVEALRDVTRRWVFDEAGLRPA